jgi:hypothetical protein
MDERKGRPVKRAVASHSKPRKPFWRKPAVWLGSFATVVAAGVLTNILTAQTQRVIPSVAPVLSAQAPTSLSASTGSKRHAAATNTGPALDVVSEDPIWVPGEQVGAWVFPNAFLLNARELAYLNSVRNTDQDAFAQWLYSHGAYEGSTDTQLVVQNNREHPIRIIGMDVVKECQPIVTGTLFYSSTAGVDPAVRMGFDLDLPDPEAMLWPQGWPSGNQQPYFANDTISIMPGAQQVFNIVAETSKFSCAFRFRVTILDGTRKVNQLIGDGSLPFRVTGVAMEPFEDYKVAPFKDYKVLYVGGLNSSSPTGDYIRVDPQKYNF